MEFVCVPDLINTFKGDFYFVSFASSNMSSGSREASMCKCNSAFGIFSMNLINSLTL